MRRVRIFLWVNFKKLLCAVLEGTQLLTVKRYEAGNNILYFICDLITKFFL